MNFWGFFLQWQIHKSWNGRSLLDGDALHWRWKGASSSELATNAILSQGKQWLVSLINTLAWATQDRIYCKAMVSSLGLQVNYSLITSSYSSLWLHVS